MFIDNLRIARNSNKYQLRTSPSNGSATITTPFVHTTASLGQTSHLFVRRGERRMHYDGTSFIVRNAGHSAGFDEKNMLKVYWNKMQWILLFVIFKTITGEFKGCCLLEFSKWVKLFVACYITYISFYLQQDVLRFGLNQRFILCFDCYKICFNV